MTLFKNEEHVVSDDGEALQEDWDPGPVTPDVWVVVCNALICKINTSHPMVVIINH